MRVQEKQWYKEAETSYNRMAKLWNTLPGGKLYKDKDAFTISYCYHKGENRNIFQPDSGLPYCKKCGYCLPFAYDT